MVRDQFQVRGEGRFFLDEVQQIVSGTAWESNPFAGQVIPDGNTGGAARADAGLAFVVVRPRALSGFKFTLDFKFEIVHGWDYKMDFVHAQSDVPAAEACAEPVEATTAGALMRDYKIRWGYNSGNFQEAEA